MTNRSDAGARRDRTEYLWFRRGDGGDGGDGGDDDDAVWPAPSGTVFHGGCDGDGGVDLDADGVDGDGVGVGDVDGKVNKDKNEDTAKVSGRSTAKETVRTLGFFVLGCSWLGPCFWSFFACLWSLA
jgi:hypothetical protein